MQTFLIANCGSLFSKRYKNQITTVGCVFTLGLGMLGGMNSSLADSSQTALSPVALFNRCYSHLTRTRVAPSNNYLQAVQSGALDPVSACMRVLESASLGSDGPQKNLIQNTTEAQAVLKTFNDFHRTWFPNDSFVTSVPVGDCRNKTKLIYDESESALHVTRALFGNKVNYSEVVTGSESLEAIRSGGPVRENSIQAFVNPRNSPSGLKTVAVPFVQQGVLLGIRPISSNPDKSGAKVNTRFSTQEVMVNQSEGGGIIGTRSYLLLNLGRPDESEMDGGLRLGRRWSKTVMSDLLCRELPLVRVADTLPYITRLPSAQTPPFRTSRNCMACHIQMDQMASAARNVVYDYTGTCNSPTNSFETIRNVPETKSREPGMVDSDPDFSKRPPNGKLFFRTYDGEMVNQDIKGIPALGSALASTNDLYVCAAARYFQYFTGIKVNLQDVGDPDNPQLTSAETAYRNKVIKLGLNLKDHQSLKELIQEIISSDLYKTASMRMLGEISNSDDSRGN